MKLRYIITSLAAVCFLAIGCTKTYPTQLENIQVSQSTIGLDAEAQRTVTVDVTANGAWKIQTEIPSWLSVSPTEGAAGKTTMTFSATASSASCNKVTLTVDCGGQKQYIYVQQGKGSPVNTAETAFTPDEAIEFYQDGKNKGAEIYVKGVVTTSKIDLSYGNAEFYLEATKGTFEFYRCFDFEGEKFTDSEKVQPGDIIIGVGAITNYNSTIELGEGCKLVSIEKSLISVCNETVLSGVASEGAVKDLKVIVKGDDLKVKATDETGAEIDWVSVRKIDTKKAEKKADPDTTVISVAFTPNVDGVRTAKFDVSSGTSTISVPVSQNGVSGTLEMPFTVDEAIKFALKLSGPTTDNYYVKGIVTRVNDQFAAQFGNATFWISDDGTHFVSEDGKSTSDKSHDFECYRVFGLTNVKWIEGEATVSVGDEVIICGQITNYNGLAETNQNKAYIYAINGCTVPQCGAGSQACPFNIKGAISAATGNFLNADKDYYVAGTITKVKDQFSTQYGNATFWLSDDGTHFVSEDGKNTTDKTHDFEAYQVWWLNNVPWTEGQPTVSVGDKVVLCGKLTNYSGLAETSKQKAYVYSHTPAN